MTKQEIEVLSLELVMKYISEEIMGGFVSIDGIMQTLLVYPQGELAKAIKEHQLMAIEEIENMLKGE